MHLLCLLDLFLHSFFMCVSVFLCLFSVCICFLFTCTLCTIFIINKYRLQDNSDVLKRLRLLTSMMLRLG